MCLDVARRSLRLCAEKVRYESMFIGPHDLLCTPGTAVFCLLSQNMTVILQRLEIPIPRKIAANSSVHENVGIRGVPRVPWLMCHIGFTTILLATIRIIHSSNTLLQSIDPSHCHRFSRMGARFGLRLPHAGSEQNW